ncbi:hypothetical protein GCM10027614_71840 [Micromonospora vulcania]
MITAPGKVEVTTVEDPTPGRREVVVRVAACGLCGTDLHILQGEFAPTLPVVPGHEFAGEVAAVGTDVTELAVGTGSRSTPRCTATSATTADSAAATSASAGPPSG